MLTELHIVQNGQGHPVVLTGGLGLCWFDWDGVTALLASDHHVVRFDRPGIGGSSPEGVPSLQVEASRIAALTRALDLFKPVLVAHSVAALHGEACARLHPDLLGGLVLVDPSCAAGGSRSAGRRSLGFRQRLAVAVLAGAGALDRATLSRRIGPGLRRALVRRQTAARNDPAGVQDVAACYGSGQALAAILSEYLMYRPMVEQLASLRTRPFPSIPLTVLTATGGMSAAAARDWRHCHQRLAAFAPGGSWVELPDSGHLIQLDRPRTVADAVISQVRSIRKPSA